MHSRALSTEHQRLIWLIDQAKTFDGNQLEMQGHWAKYICVLAAGFLENAIAEIYSVYARQTSSPPVASFVEAVLWKIQNPKSRRFLETARSFNPQWESSLEKFLSENGRKEAIDAIIANRHLIAHGRDSGISLARVSEYLKKSVEVLEFIENQCRGIAR